MNRHEVHSMNTRTLQNAGRAGGITGYRHFLQLH